MEKLTVYQRTAKGDVEISKRLYKLDHEHRFVLIMIDGKSTADQIVSKSSEQWNPVKCLFELEKQGFIENIDPNTEQQSKFSQLREDLIAAIEGEIPEKNTKVVNKILNADLNKETLSKAIDSSCILIKLTISEKISNKLKIKLHRILNMSSEV